SAGKGPCLDISTGRPHLPRSSNRATSSGGPDHAPSSHLIRLPPGYSTTNARDGVGYGDDVDLADPYPSAMSAPTSSATSRSTVSCPHIERSHSAGIPPTPQRIPASPPATHAVVSVSLPNLMARP